MLIEGMKRAERLLNPVMPKQFLTFSGILTPNHISSPQKGQSPKANILQVANGGGDYPEPPHGGRYFLLLPLAEALELALRLELVVARSGRFVGGRMGVPLSMDFSKMS
jgi:hypothetical protein